MIKIRGKMDNVGTYEGDRNIVEGENDGDAFLEY